MNYFTLFNIPKIFKIDHQLLHKNFYKLQTQFHPDLFINCTSCIQKRMLKKIIDINTGYNILKDNLSRAEHILFLEGIVIKKEDFCLNNQKDFKIFLHLYDKLEALKKEHVTSDKLKFFSQQIKDKIEQCEIKISKAFAEKNQEQVLQIIKNLFFLKKIDMSLK